MKTFVARIPNLILPLLASGAIAVGLTHAVPAQADAAAGQNAFAVCSACHSVDGSDGVGPHLNGVVGRKAGSVAGFAYSTAVKKSDIVWDAAHLNSYIADPQKAIPGNHMPFSGVPEAGARADIVAYLATLH